MRFFKFLPISTVLIVIVCTVLMILSTDRLSQTHDEAGHIAAGMEWFQGSYELSPQNPPFSRVWSALVPYLQGFRIDIPEDIQEHFWDYGGAGGPVQVALDSHGEYRKNLGLARLGTILVYLISLLLVYLFGRKLKGKRTACIAVILLASTPLVMAHSSLTTTDVPAMATCLLAVFLIFRWLDHPDWRRSVIMGLGLTLAICTKFTAFLFITPSLVLLLTLKVIALESILTNFTG